MSEKTNLAFNQVRYDDGGSHSGTDHVLVGTIAKRFNEQYTRPMIIMRKKPEDEADGLKPKPGGFGPIPTYL